MVVAVLTNMDGACGPTPNSLDALLQLCSAQPGDSELQLANKKQKLLLLRQAYCAWLAKSSCCDANAAAEQSKQQLRATSLQEQQQHEQHLPPQQLLHKRKLPPLQQCLDHVEQQRALAEPSGCQPAPPDATEQQPLQELHLQQQLPLQQEQQQQKPSKQKQLLAYLFGHEAAAVANGLQEHRQQHVPGCKHRLLATVETPQQLASHGSKAFVRPDADVRHISNAASAQQLEPWRVSKKHQQEPQQQQLLLLQEQKQQEHKQQSTIRQQQHRMQLAHQQGRRRRHQHHQQQQEQQNLMQPPAPEQQQQHLQHEVQDPWLHVGQQQCFDAQSQAIGSTRHGLPWQMGRQAAAAGNLQQQQQQNLSVLPVRCGTTRLAPVPAGQQLFSPRTATHAPMYCEGSCNPGDEWQQQNIPWQQQQQQAGQCLAADTRSAEQQQQQQYAEDGGSLQPASSQPPQCAASKAAEAETQIGALPGSAVAASPDVLLRIQQTSDDEQQQLEVIAQQQQMDLTPQPVQHDLDVVAATPLQDNKLVVACTPASKQRQQQHLPPYLAESPAAATATGTDPPVRQQHTLASKPLLGSCVVAESPVVPCSPAAAEVAGTAAVAAPGLSFLAQQRNEVEHLPLYQQRRGAAADSAFAAPTAGPVAACTAGTACVEQQQDMVSHSGNAVFLGRRQQGHRARSVHIGQPVVGITSCEQQCVVITQQQCADSTNSFELLQLHVQQSRAGQQGPQQQQQQPDGADVRVSFIGAATLVLQGQQCNAVAAPAATAAAAVKVLPQPLRERSRCNNEPVDLPQKQQELLLAVALPFEVQSVGDKGDAAAVAAPVDRRARSESPAGVAAAVHTPASTTGARSLRALSHSTGRRKALLAAEAAAAGKAAIVAEQGTLKHGVSIYRMSSAQHHCNSYDMQDNNSARNLLKQRQQQQSGVQHVQMLSTSNSVTCLAVSEHAQCIAAGGTAGFACVWPLWPQQQLVEQHAQQQQAVDGSGVIALPAATYRGICFTALTELCLILQAGCAGSATHTPEKQQQQQHCDGSSSDALSDPNIRVLLVGCSSIGSIAVWDVKQQQQIMAVHNPDLPLCGLMPLQPQLPLQQRQQQELHQTGLLPQPLLLLAMVDARNSSSTPPTAALKAVSKLGKASAEQQVAESAKPMGDMGLQQQQFELRPVLLQEPGLLLPGALVLPHQQEQQGCQKQQRGSVIAAALSGTVAAAVCAAGYVRVWDVLTGRSFMHTKAAAAAATAGRDVTAVQVVGLQRNNDQGQQVKSWNRATSGAVVMLGTSGGVLSVALL